MRRPRARATLWRHPQAKQDLLEIWLSVARDSPLAADRLIDAIEERCSILAAHPEIGPPRPDIAPAARMLTFGRYLILYKISGKRVEIVRVVHGARRLENLL